jgi:hypothetical protein
MTTDLEKQFFDTFGIEPKIDCDRCGAKEFASEQCYQTECVPAYPLITDRHYLELIEILLSFEYIGFKKGKDHYSVDFQGWLEQRESSLKNAILNALIVVANSDFKDVVYNQVRTLFEEG